MARKKDVPLSQVLKGTEQLSDAELRERIRSYIPSVILKLVELSNSTNENVALGASKTLLNKGIPDLKAIEIKGSKDHPFIFKVVDYATREGDTTTTEAN